MIQVHFMSRDGRRFHGAHTLQAVPRKGDLVNLPGFDGGRRVLDVEWFVNRPVSGVMIYLENE